MHKRSFGLIALLLFVCFLGAACGENAAFDSVRNSSATSSGERLYGSAVELAEQIAERHENDAGSLHRVVRGNITAVEPGRSFTWLVEPDGDERVELPFGDGEAMVHTSHLTIEVSEVLVPQGDRLGGVLTVGVVVGADVSFESVKDDYGSLDEVVLFLHPSPVFDYEAGLLSIYEGGALMGALGGDGRVRFPLLENPEGLLNGESSVAVAQLRAP